MSRPTRVALVLFASLLAVLGVAAEADGDATDRLLTLANEARADEDLPPLEEHEGLERAAEAYAADLAERGELSHESGVEGMETPGARVARAGVALVEIGENLSFIEGGEVAERTIQGWLDSPGHRRNLLDPDYDAVGHGVARSDGRAYVVQLLGASPITRSAASAEATGEGSVVVELRYEEEDVPLELFVGGEHQRGAARDGGVLRAELPVPEGPVRVSVGIDEGDGHVRVVEEFTLRPGDEPELVPGAPEGAP